MATINNLQTIVDNWGDQFAKKFGGVDRSHGGERGVCYDGTRKMMEPYQWAKTEATVRNFVYGPVQPSSYKPDVLFHLVVPNEGSKDISQTIKKVQNRSSTNSWSNTVGLSLTVEQSIKISAGPIESTTKLSATMSTSTTTGTSVTTQETWEVNSTITCVPQKTTTIDWVLTYADLSVPFTYEVLLTGYVGIWLNNRVDIYGGNNNHNLWFLPISQVFQEYPQPNFAVRDGGVVFTGQGTFTGVPGVNSTLKSKETPLGNELKSAPLLKSSSMEAPATTIHSTRLLSVTGDHVAVFNHYGERIGFNPNDVAAAKESTKEEKKEEKKESK